MRAPALALCLACLAAPLAAQEGLRPGDAARLNGFEESAARGLLAALAGGAPGDVQSLSGALSGKPEVALDQSLAGEWQCRTLKLGGLSDLIVYSYFKCRFTLRPDGVGFEKLTGSQRTRGTIRYLDGRAVYVGVGYVAGEDPPPYAELPADFQPDGRVETEVALFERVGPDRARLMFPAPATESEFDILELRR